VTPPYDEPIKTLVERQLHTAQRYNDARQASSNMLAAALAVATQGDGHGAS
jgi:hypothetical protein